MRLQPSPVVQLNRAVAVAMGEGEERGLKLIDALMESGELSDYYLAHSARGALLGRIGRRNEAIIAYSTAADLTDGPQKQFLVGRIAELRSESGQY